MCIYVGYGHICWVYNTQHIYPTYIMMLSNIYSTSTQHTYPMYIVQVPNIYTQHIKHNNLPPNLTNLFNADQYKVCV